MARNAAARFSEPERQLILRLLRDFKGRLNGSTAQRDLRGAQMIVIPARIPLLKIKMPAGGLQVDLSVNDEGCVL